MAAACGTISPSNRYGYLMNDRQNTTSSKLNKEVDQDEYVYVEREIVKNGKRVMVLVKERRQYADMEGNSAPKQPVKSTNPEVPDFVWPSANKSNSSSNNSPRYTSANADVEQAIQVAKSYLGVPYVYGGTSRKGMDCSGLVYTAYQSVNKKLPRNSAAMAKTKSGISRNRLRKGDLVFFNSKNTPGIHASQAE